MRLRSTLSSLLNQGPEHRIIHVVDVRFNLISLFLAGSEKQGPTVRLSPCKVIAHLLDPRVEYNPAVKRRRVTKMRVWEVGGPMKDI
jgi:hypothetical protein